MTNRHRWIATSVTPNGRYDDIFFITERTGWVVGGTGQVLRTEDGGRTWSPPTNLPSYPRAIGMRDESFGWIGCINGRPPLLYTNDGWRHAMPVRNLPTERCGPLEADAPSAVCGLQVFDQDHIFATGTNFPLRPARFLFSSNGGQTWRAHDMEDHATILVDVFFTSPSVGWLVGGRATKPHALRADVVPCVLKTEDGGTTWHDKLRSSPQVNPPLGEWGWKIQFVDQDFVVVACENFRAGAILISEDGGESWRRQEIRNGKGAMINANLEGIGFLDRKTGWVGGWGDEAISSGLTSGTRDGGATWEDLTAAWPEPLVYRAGSATCDADRDKGQYINRFRFIGNVGYASGNTVYKYTDEPESAFGAIGQTARRFVSQDGPLRYDETAEIPITLEPGAKSLRVEVFDRFGDKVKSLVDESDPPVGSRIVEWGLEDDAGHALPTGQYQVRVAVDQAIECRLLFHRLKPAVDDKEGYVPYMLAGE